MRIFSILIIIFIFINQKSIAQNVGIGTTTPQKTLDVNGNFRSGGSNNFITHDSASGKITWNNSYLFVPAPQYIIKHSASAEGLYSNGAQLEYRDQLGAPAFFTNWTNGYGYFSSKLGIGVLPTTVPLGFSQGLGDKISLYPNSSVNYGFGVQPSLLQIHTDLPAADIAFGYGSSASFTENMRVKGSGDVGIGVTTPSGYGHGGNNRIMEINNPNTGVDIQSHIILSTNGTSGSAGGITWASKNVPGSEKRLGFIGSGYETSNATRLDFYTRNQSGIFAEKLTILGNGNVGIGTLSPNVPLGFPPSLGKKITLYPGATGDVGLGVAGNRLQIYSDNPNADVAIGYDAAGTFNERFAFKPNGALAVNGSTGTQGQFLQSNGSGTAATWSSSTNALYNNTVIVNGTASITLSPSGVYNADLPGLSYTLNGSTNTKALLSFNIPIHTNSCFSCGASGIYIYLLYDGSIISQFIWNISNDFYSQLSGSSLLTITPGTHTINLNANVSSLASPASVTFEYTPPGTVVGIANNIIIQLIPQ